MAKLEECVRSVQADGLLWGMSKLVPVGYGIKKLQIACVVEDDKVGTDLLEEELTKFEDYVSTVQYSSLNVSGKVTHAELRRYNGTDWKIETRDRRKQKRWNYCIVPGCKDEFYKVKTKDKTVHFINCRWKGDQYCSSAG